MASNAKLRRISSEISPNHPEEDQFALSVARRLTELPSERIEFAKDKVDQLLRSIECNLADLPELVLLKILDEFHAVKDILAFCSTTPRLRTLIGMRVVWRRYQRITVVWDEWAWAANVSFSSSEDDIFVKMPTTCLTKVQAAFAWLLLVARPEQLQLQLKVCFKDDAKGMQHVADAIPPRDNICSPQRFFLNIQSVQMRSQCCVASFGELIKKLPTTMTYLRMEIVTPTTHNGNGIGPMLGKWLRDCSELETFHCLDVPGRAQSSLLGALKMLPKLTTLCLNRMVDVLHSNSIATIRHLCFKRSFYATVGQPKWPICDRARENVTSVCCLLQPQKTRNLKAFHALFGLESVSRMALFHRFPHFFPNCRKIGLDAYVADNVLQKLCAAYAAEQAGREEKLQLCSSYFRPQQASPEPTAVELVVIERGNCCEVERLFNP